MCAYHQSRLSLESCLAGKALGHERRWAQDFYDKHQGSVEEGVASLGEALDECAAGTRVSALLTAKPGSEISNLDADLKKLDGAGDSFSTNLKHKLLDRHLDRVLANGSFSQYLVAACPWVLPGCSSRRFSLVAPQLAFVEGSPAEHATTFRVKVFHMLAILVRRGSTGSEEMTRCLDCIPEFIFSSQGEVDSDGEGEGQHDAYDTVMDLVTETVAAMRLLLSVGTSGLSPTRLKASSHLQMILDAKDSKGGGARPMT